MGWWAAEVSGGWVGGEGGLWREEAGREGMGGGGRADLRFECDGAEAVEELEGRDDLALHEDAGRDCCRRPEARAYGHLVEPLL